MTDTNNISQSLMKSYAIRKITDILDAEEIKHYIVPSNFDISLYVSGCVVVFTDSNLYLSIQTSPSVVGTDFCQTCLITDEGIVHCPTLGYTNIIRHDEPFDFQTHIRDLKARITGYNTDMFEDLTIDEFSTNNNETSVNDEISDSETNNSNISSRPINNLLSLLLLSSMMNTQE